MAVAAVAGAGAERARGVVVEDERVSAASAAMEAIEAREGAAMRGVCGTVCSAATASAAFVDAAAGQHVATTTCDH